MDDHLSSAQNKWVQQGFSGIDDIIVSPYLDEGDARYGGYRPIPRISHAIEFGIWGARPAMAHAINVFSYFLCCYLSFLFLRHPRFSFQNQSIWIWLGVAIFAFHPLHVEVVASLKNREVLLSFIFGMSFVLTLLKEDKTFLNYLFAFILLFGTLFCKLDSMIYPAFSIIILFFSFPSDWKKDLVFIIGSLIIILGINYGIQQSFPKPLNLAYTLEENPLIHSMWTGQHFSTVFYIVLYLSRLIFIPDQQLFFYGTGKIDIVSWGNVWVLFSLIFHLAILVVSLLLFKRKKVLGLFFMLYLACLGLNSNLLILVPGIIGDRLLFTAILPVAGIFITGLSILQNKFESKNSKSLILLPGILFIAVSFYYGMKRVPCWENGVTLGQCDIAQLANSNHAHTIFIKLLASEIPTTEDKTIQNKLIDSSIKYSKNALALNPKSIVAINNLGNVYCQYRDSIELGSKVLLEGMKIDPNNALILRSIGKCFEKSGDVPSALKFYEEALKNADYNIDLRFKMFGLLINQSKMIEAKGVLDELNRRAPESKSTMMANGMWFSAQGKNAEATAVFEKILKKYPDMVELKPMIEAYYRSLKK